MPSISLWGMVIAIELLGLIVIVCYFVIMVERFFSDKPESKQRLSERLTERLNEPWTMKDTGVISPLERAMRDES